MGYRININNVSTIGHLIEGNVISYLEEITSNENNFGGAIEYLNNLFDQSSKDLISFNPKINNQINALKEEWPQILDKLNKYNRTKDQNVLEYFKRMSNILNRFKYKFLILPGFRESSLNRHLIDETNLMRWLRNSSHNSYLIIQLKDQPLGDDIQIINSFKHYNLALDRIDEWPGILIWENYFGRSRGVFIPLHSIEEVEDIFLKFRFERDFFEMLRSHYGDRSIKDSVELIHLSDLHLGTKRESSKVRRLLRLLENHSLSTVDDKITIISGDLIDDQNEENVNKYNDFENSLSRIGYDQIIKVPGNHDYIRYGFLPLNRLIPNTIMDLFNEDAIKIYEQYKLIIIKFNSNKEGDWAQGSIGAKQMAEIGNQLDSIRDLDQYCIIAVLHHHPFELSRPFWMKANFYERVLGFSIMNATLCLKDSANFIEWIKLRGIKYIIHGHNHIPLLATIDEINVISGGSSTGVVKHVDAGKTFITYNVIKYDIKQRVPISSTIIFEEILGSGTKHYQIKKYA